MAGCGAGRLVQGRLYEEKARCARSGFAKAHGAEMKKIPPKRDFPRNILLTLVARQAIVQPKMEQRVLKGCAFWSTEYKNSLKTSRKIHV
ncbi:hypothetical protein [Parasutterella excrementihominis]|uniref:hypothetical protein n=1 Tax=Parasutterella excrementihominis TaxID=487175 RepID=UPI00242D8DDA|nr:hypothetical protein [Parasutterella excrementihominis]